MKKKFNFLMMIAFSFLVCITFASKTNAFAADRESFLNSMPEDMRRSVESDMKKRDLSGNATVQTKYYKVNLKDEEDRTKVPLKDGTNIESDLVYTPVSEKEFNENSNKNEDIIQPKISTRAVVEKTEGPVSNSWMKLSLLVDPHYSNKNRVTAYLYFDWRKSPIARFTDANNISWSDHLIIPLTNNPIYSYFTAYFQDGSGQIYRTPPVQKGKFGILQEVNLNVSRHYYQGTLGTDLEFATQGTTDTLKANIFSEYAHSQISGNVSVGSDGKPSFGYSVSVDRANGPTSVVRNK